jgi:hypothetical protein
MEHLIELAPVVGGGLNLVAAVVRMAAILITRRQERADHTIETPTPQPGEPLPDQPSGRSGTA